MPVFGLILSIFAVVALGYGFGRKGVFSDRGIKGLSDFVWYAAIPALMFRSMAHNHIPGGEELLLVLFYYGAALTIYALNVLGCKFLFSLPLREGAALGLNATFANGMMLGVPLISGLFGEEGLRILMILIAFHAPLLVSLTSLLAEWGQTEGRIGAVLLNTLKRLIRQPVLIALFLGLLMAGYNLELPFLIDNMTKILAAAVAPCGLFAVGATISNVRVRGDLPQALFVTLMKLMIFPLGVYLILQLSPLPDKWIATATIMAALPTGVIAYHFSAANGIAPQRSASAFVLANFLAILSLSLWAGWLTQS